MAWLWITDETIAARKMSIKGRPRVQDSHFQHFLVFQRGPHLSWRNWLIYAQAPGRLILLKPLSVVHQFRLELKVLIVTQKRCHKLIFAALTSSGKRSMTVGVQWCFLPSKHDLWVWSKLQPQLFKRGCSVLWMRDPAVSVSVEGRVSWLCGVLNVFFWTPLGRGFWIFVKFR